jgi:retron-type reverse transcriptase
MQTEFYRIMGLPIIRDVQNLSKHLGFNPVLVERLVWRAEVFYKQYRIPKRSGGVRIIQAPTYTMKAAQAWVLRNILDKLSSTPIATAFREGKSILDNCDAHASNRYFVGLDIKDFFPSITRDRIASIFSMIGYEEDASEILSSLCCLNDRLPQGAVTSPALSNLICHKLDRRLMGLAAVHNLTVSRYADDITFSNNNPKVLRGRIHTIRRIIEHEGFKVNLSKLRFCGPESRCTVTGLVKNSSVAKFGIGRAKTRRMRAIIYQLSKGGAPDSDYPSESSVAGYLQFLRSVDLVAFRSLMRSVERTGLSRNVDVWGNLMKAYNSIAISGE